MIHVSPLASEHGQSHLHYGPDLPFEDGLFTDPLNPDTDGDNVTDGKEINGYDLVWMETMSDGSVKDHKLRAVKSNPLDPTNGMRDTDGDGMPDYKEVHYEEFYPFIVNWANDQHRQNPNDFNATEYLEKQFNSFVRENIPPIILSMSITTQKEDVYLEIPVGGILGAAGSIKLWIGYHFYTDIRARLYDTGEISRVTIWKDFGNGAQVFTSSSNGWYNTTIDIGVFEALTLYIVHVVAEDHAGNALKYNYTVKGVVCKVLDFYIDLWNAFVDTMVKAWKAVKSAASFLWGWIKNIIQQAIITFVDGMKALFNMVIKSYVAFVECLYENLSNGTRVLGAVQAFMNAIMEMAFALATLFGILMTAMLIVKVVTGGVEAAVASGIVDLAKNTILMALLPVVGGEIVESVMGSASGENENTLMDKLFIAMGISLEGAEKIISAISSAFSVILLKKSGGSSFSWRYIVKYAAIAIALTSFLWVYVGPAVKRWVPYAGVVISGLGLAIFIIDKLMSRNSPMEQVEENAFPVVNLMEWLLPFVGFINAVREVAQ